VNEIYDQLRNLRKEISEVDYYYPDKITHVIRLFEHGLEIVKYVKSYPEVGTEELEIIESLGKFILYFGKSNRWGRFSKKFRERLYQLVDQMEKEVASVRKMDLFNVKYTDLNEWIASLNICKFLNQHIEAEPYFTSYEVYVDLRKALMDQKMPTKRQIYTGRIVDQLEDGRKKLSDSCKIEVMDYELSQLMKMIRDNPKFNYRLQHSSVILEQINDSIEREMQLGRQKIYDKKLAILPGNSKNNF